MIGIIAAMDIELELIKKAARITEEKKTGSITYTVGFIGDCKFVCAVCGMGKVNAAICAQTMICNYKPDVIINTGVAGGISSELSICDIVIADALYEHDLDITALGYPLGYIGAENVTKIPASKELALKLSECAKSVLSCNVLNGVIVSGDQFIGSNEKKKFLRDTFNADACEMEGAAIGHVCFMNEVPFAVIRAISDGASEEANMDFNTFAKKAAENSSALIINFLKGQI